MAGIRVDKTMLIIILVVVIVMLLWAITTKPDSLMQRPGESWENYQRRIERDRQEQPEPDYGNYRVGD